MRIPVHINTRVCFLPSSKLSILEHRSTEEMAATSFKINFIGYGLDADEQI